MKIACENCGTLIDTDKNNRCPNCGASIRLNPDFNKEKEYNYKNKDLDLRNREADIRNKEVQTDIMKDKQNNKNQLFKRIITTIIILSIIVALYIILFRK